MSYDGWLEYGGVEVINLARTAALARVLGVTMVWTRPEQVEWVPTTLGTSGYGDITKAPWYDAAYPASSEFIGLVPLSLQGLDDSTVQAGTIEYLTAGGKTGVARSTTKAVVASVVIMASTSRGAAYGKQWLDALLAGNPRLARTRPTSGITKYVVNEGAPLHYFSYEGAGAPIVHRNKVRLTRGTVLSRERSNVTSVAWTVGFTLTCDDPYEYGAPVPKVTALGGTAATGPGVTSQGTLTSVVATCPSFDYSPIFDPAFPALIDAPVPPDFLPDGWEMTAGQEFKRYWARISPVRPSSLDVVPIIRLTSPVAARMLRLAVWDSASPVDDQCDPLFSAIVTYLPPEGTFYIDAEKVAAYTWDGASPTVRRADSVVYGPEANPLRWTDFNDPTNLLVTLDTLRYTGGAAGYQGDGAVRMALDLVPRAD